MTELTLVLANKAYSSWSMRAWLALRQAGWRFDEIVVPLYLPESPSEVLRHSPSGRLPVLVEGATRIWDSLAICEYAAERSPEAGLWPADAAARSHARAVACEMHAGFPALRSELPMNCRRHYRSRALSDAVRAEVRRVVELWDDCRRRHGRDGDAGMLFGGFTIADAMYAPVVSRFRTYGVELHGAARAYADAVAALPLYRAWEEAADAEPWVIDRYEF